MKNFVYNVLINFIMVVLLRRFFPKAVKTARMLYHRNIKITFKEWFIPLNIQGHREGGLGVQEPHVKLSLLQGPIHYSVQYVWQDKMSE